MKYKFLILLVFTCISCNHTENDISITLDYPENAMIEWNYIFDQIDNDYFVYFFSANCGHCINFKSTILVYYYSQKSNLFFCEVTDGYKKIKNMDEVIGCTDINNFAICGTPLLIEINNHVVSNYFVGSNAITVFINNK